MSSNRTEDKIKSWLTPILHKDGAANISSLTIMGNTEKGDGYIGDIVFVNVTTTQENGTTKDYKLVLKCSKQSQALREQSQIKYTYLNEMFVYDEVLSSFVKFQRDRGVKQPFTSIPKCYGTFVGENIEVIVLENLKQAGYELWPRQEPLTRNHINLVIEEYGKLHATAVAMEQLEPTKFRKLVEGLEKNGERRVTNATMFDVFKKCILETCDVLGDELDPNALERLTKFSANVPATFLELTEYRGVKVVVHWDCWSNNFMYKYQNCQETPTKVVMLDWQMSRYGMPVWDLSYFLFCCMAKDDFGYINDILRDYHRSFISHLEELGVKDADQLYPIDKLLMDWKQYSKGGVLMSSLIMKTISADENEMVDIEKGAEKGKSFSESFMIDVGNKELFKNRMRPIVHYALEHDLI